MSFEIFRFLIGQFCIKSDRIKTLQKPCYVFGWSFVLK